MLPKRWLGADAVCSAVWCAIQSSERLAALVKSIIRNGNFDACICPLATGVSWGESRCRQGSRRRMGPMMPRFRLFQEVRELRLLRQRIERDPSCPRASHESMESDRKEGHP